jgi:NAD(P)-dependent dehydrogenase (short-subunit alcohol dehydrogenase family)
VAVVAAREGAEVALSGLFDHELQEIRQEVKANGQRCLTWISDVTDPDQCRKLLDDVASALGGIDVLVVNAGITGMPAPLATADIEAMLKVYDVNVFGAMRLVQAALPYLRKSEAPAIVLVSSLSERASPPMLIAYSGSKAALVNSARTLARELGGEGIRVNTIVPGIMNALPGDQLARSMGLDPNQYYAQFASMSALGRVSKPEEVADAIVYLASNRASAITGQTLDVNAGASFH